MAVNVKSNSRSINIAEYKDLNDISNIVSRLNLMFRFSDGMSDKLKLFGGDIIESSGKGYICFTIEKKQWENMTILLAGRENGSNKSFITVASCVYDGTNLSMTNTGEMPSSNSYWKVEDKNVLGFHCPSASKIIAIAIGCTDLYTS